MARTSQKGGSGYTFDPNVGGGGGSTFYNATSGEALGAGEVVRFDDDGGGDAGRAYRARAFTALFEAVGIVEVAVAGVGLTVRVQYSGNGPVTFSVAPAAADNGKQVYLSPDTLGRATLTIPSAPGQAIVRLGKLTGGDGATTSPTVLLDIYVVATLG